jgi:oxalate decarboxylase
MTFSKRSCRATRFGDAEMQLLALFRAPHYEEISLSDWLTHSPPALVAQHLNVDEATIAKWLDSQPVIMRGAY